MQGGHNLYGPAPNMNSVIPMPNLPTMPLPPPGLPPFNPADPMSFLTMAAALGMGLPGMAQMPFGSPLAMGLSGSNGQPHLATREEQCNDYVTKGFCVLGSVCPYQHGGEVIQSSNGMHSPFSGFAQIQASNLGLTLVLEYDPENASLTVKREKGPDRQRNRSYRNDAESRVGSRTRALFSEAGPTTDRTNATIVVEQIPEEHFNEDAVRSFFSQFGHIASVEMQAYKRLAIVKYNDHFAACRAYDSPKVIFDNRFVKVYWLKSDSPTEPPVNRRSTNVNNETDTAQHLPYDQDEEMLVAEEIEKRQAEAQIAWEQRQKKIQEAAAKLEDVQEKIKAKEDEIRELRKKVAEKDGVEFVDESQDTSLMEQLKSLQAEALDLGLNSQGQGDTFMTRGRGRGGYRGRFPTRARGVPFWGSHRGHGAPYIPAGARTGVKRLDNRTKRLAVTGIEAGSLKDEALRQHLLVNNVSLPYFPIPIPNGLLTCETEWL
jgi:RNA recognition motif-containing protein